uniref:Large terminase n=1 Tax=Siphoviridae sp. ctqwY3 TaxID=2827951 RepID=A0A8S5S7E2_9CAUD|nr:MAG TPA: large terminase [Siphoviridae sp. ctqwY3]
MPTISQLQVTLSKKQSNLLNDIVAKDVNEIFVLGSTQSGKTFDICLGIILYAQALYEYDPHKQYNGAIVGWSIDTLKGNIADVIEQDLQAMGLVKKVKGVGDYDLKWGSGDEKFLKLYNLKIYFFGFNNVLAFNKILGKPLILEWVDESARIYTQKQLQQPFNELPGRQVSFANHPFLKTIHSFNVEGSENHDYKKDYLDKKPYAKHYTFFPYDNPVLNTKEAIQKVVNMFPPGSLREQKIYNRWCVAEGKVFSNINILHSLDGFVIREIGLGNDYGSVNPTTFVPIALCYNTNAKRWVLIRLQCFFHDPKVNGDTPTTEFYSKQLRLFMVYLKKCYPHVPITTNVIDSEASHFDNRLTVDNIPHSTSKKGPGSVDTGVQHLQSLIQKEYYYILEMPSITMFRDNGEPVLSGKDESLLEYESYQYDSIKSVREGINCYKKENDHSIDASRYLIDEWKDTGRCPVV